MLINLSTGGNAMKVNARDVKFALELISALAIAAAGLVSKYYIDAPKS